MSSDVTVAMRPVAAVAAAAAVVVVDADSFSRPALATAELTGSGRVDGDAASGSLTLWLLLPP